MNLKWTAHETEIEKTSPEISRNYFEIEKQIKTIFKLYPKTGNSKRGTDYIWRNKKTKFRVCRNPFNKTKGMTQTLGKC